MCWLNYRCLRRFLVLATLSLCFIQTLFWLMYYIDAILFAKRCPGHIMDKYNRQTPLIFIGGMPRSGTTLMRAILDAHPYVRCGQETRIIATLLAPKWMSSEGELKRLEEAGLTKSLLDDALANHILEIIVRHGKPALRLCNKDPFTLMNGDYLLKLFPNCKFIFMMRDGRATVHSIISRDISVGGFDNSSYRASLKMWSHNMEIMNNHCKTLGSGKCLSVPYEQLVLHPRLWIQKVLKYLDLPWNETVMHHQNFINNGIVLSRFERATDQVVKPINLEALTKWVGKMPKDVVEDMPSIAPMLAELGYDPYANPPKYGTPDIEVVNNTREIERNKLFWAKKVKESIKGE